MATILKLELGRFSRLETEHHAEHCVIRQSRYQHRPRPVHQRTRMCIAGFGPWRLEYADEELGDFLGCRGLNLHLLQHLVQVAEGFLVSRSGERPDWEGVFAPHLCLDTARADNDDLDAEQTKLPAETGRKAL